MICDYCEPWAATTREQLINRMRNVKRAPEVQFHKCPQCGGVDWATTSTLIITHDRAEQGWWRRAHGYAVRRWRRR